MRIFFAGASGVIGAQLIPMLVEQGHVVGGMSRSYDKADAIRSLGAQPFVCDVYDAAELAETVQDFKPDMVMSQLTDLPDDPSQVSAFSASNARMRREGISNLIAAARTADVSRLMAQSVAWPLDGEGGAAVRDMEQAVIGFGGVVLRYGMFYGPNTYNATNEDLGNLGVSVKTAARRTMEELEAPAGSIITITD